MKTSAAMNFAAAPPHSARRARSGFATASVVLMMIYIAVTVTTLSLLFAAEARRTKSAAQTAQLRELLLAAAPLALDELERNGPAPREITLPTPVPQTTLTLKITASTSGKAEVRITAKSTSSAAAQTLLLTHPATHWQLQSATLTPAP